MFKNKTVFILGAGASWHYDYATGEELVKLAIKKARELANLAINYHQRHLNRHEILSGFFPDYLCAKKKLPERCVDIDQTKSAWNSFSADCLNLANRLEAVNPLVIDYFLDWNSSLRDIGELIIAWVILECETKKDGRKIIEKNDWYRFIVNQLASKCTNANDLLSNDVTFITFNYDVSLENYLHRGLHAIDQFENGEGTISKFLNKDRVLHVYGKVRNNPFENSEFGTLGNPHIYHDSTADTFASFPPTIDYNGLGSGFRDYCKENHSYYLEAFNKSYHASKNLRTIGATKDTNDVVIKTAHNEIKDAKVVYILGYGFDKNNNERLKLHEYLHAKGDAQLNRLVQFTNFEDRNLINKRAGRLFLNEPKAFLPPNLIHGDSINGPIFYEKSVRNVYEAIERDFDDLENQLTFRTSI